MFTYNMTVKNQSHISDLQANYIAKRLISQVGQLALANMALCKENICIIDINQYEKWTLELQGHSIGQDY